MSNFASINLSLLAPPAALEAWSYQGIVDAMSGDFGARMAGAGIPYDVGALESDPAVMLIETSAYREGLVRQRVNDAVLATSLAYALGADLDVIAADYSTLRQSGELDPSLRTRAQLAWENLSFGGSYGGYRYQALSAAPAALADVAVYGHEIPGVASGEVRIICLGANPGGVPSATTLAAVLAAVNQRNRRKVNDLITVAPANLAPYTVDAVLTLVQGADANAVIAAQSAKLQAFAAARFAIGAYVTPAMIAAVLAHDDPGLVYDVKLNLPYAEIGGGPFDAPMLTGLRLSAVQSTMPIAPPGSGP